MGRSRTSAVTWDRFRQVALLSGRLVLARKQHKYGDERVEFPFHELGTKGHSAYIRPSIGYGGDALTESSIEIGYKVI